MTAKEYLSEYRWLLKRIKSKTEQIEHLKAKVVYSSPKLTGGTGNGKSDKVGNIVATIDRLQQQLDALLEQKKTIEDQVEQIENPRQCIVLTERYIKGRKVKAVAKFMNYSERTVEYLIAQDWRLLKKNFRL